MLAVLSNTPGGGTVSVNVDGFGAYGSNIGPSGGNANYDPVGPIASAGTTFLSGVSLHVNGTRQWLATGFGTGLANPATTGSSAVLESEFARQGLTFELEQRLSDLFVGAGEGAPERSGTLLTQSYRITNTTATAITFDLYRYVDGDLSFDGSIDDGGGRLPFGDSEILFETDSATGSATEATFVGITAQGGAIPATNRFEVGRYDSLRSKIQNGTTLSNAVANDGSDEDQFVDAGRGYDLALALRNHFILEPGASDVYITRTIFGTGNPDALAQVSSLELGPAVAERPATSTHTVTATALDSDGQPVVGARIEFSVSGANSNSGFAFTDFNGVASFSYSGANVGSDSIVATAGLTSTQPVQVSWLPVPNLTILNPTVPEIARRGATINVGWTVTNVDQEIAAGQWTDSVYLSTDAVLDPNDQILGGFLHQNRNLGPAESYTRDFGIVIPASTPLGNYFLLLATDTSDAVFERSNADNVTSRPIQVTLPDLTVNDPVGVSAIGSFAFGSPLDVSWTVRNQGLVEAVNNSMDRVWLSTDAVPDAGDRILANVPAGADIPLVPSASYTRSTLVSLPLLQSLLPGTYYVIVEADATGVEPETSNANNWRASASLVIAAPPLPDLMVASISAPANAISNGAIPISWEIRNNGDAPISGTFQDRIYLSADATIGGDATYGTFEFQGTILPGQTVVRTQNITLPPVLQGNFRVVVTTDIANQVFEQHGRENNNSAIDNQPIAVQLAPFPNLQVSDVIAPPSAFSEQEVLIEWIVANNGNGPTSVPSWVDRVYLSQDTVFDASDTLLGSVNNPAFLGTGDSYRNSLTATLPRGIDDQFYFIVRTDVNNNVFEYNGESDNAGVSEVTDVQLTPPPDLRVTTVQAPAGAFSGQSVTVNWSVTNEGPGATRTEGWSDRVYFSADNVFDASDTLLTTVGHSGAIGPGATYSASGSGTLPIGVSGNFFFIVQTDAFNNVFEHVFEANNAGFDAQPTAVSLTPPPDLEIELVDAPFAATSSRSLSVNYRVANHGATETPNTSWNDRLFLSADNVFDAATDLQIATRTHLGALEPGESYSESFNATLSNTIVGSYFVFVVTDFGNTVFELDNANNVRSDSTPLAITSQPANLSVANFTAPSAAEAGDSFLLSWIVQNVGIGDTATSSWFDRVVLSSDTIPSGNDLVLASVNHSGLLNPQANYAVNNRPVQIPFNIAPGSYFLLLTTDAGNNVFEAASEGDNLATPIAITISRDESDLRVTSVTASDSVASGGNLAVQWTVRNDSPVATNANFWFDQVYLSANNVIDDDDALLGTVQRSNPLAPNAQYSVSRNFALPKDITGQFFVIVRTDSSNVVIEGPFENNNDRTMSGSVEIGLSLVPDLAVTNVNAPADGFGGQPFQLSWTVNNVGQTATNVSWYDSVYLSLDQVFDRATDTYLGFANRPNNLAVGASYTQTESFIMPAGFAGQYYVFVVADGNDRVFERGAELNNTGLDPISMLITLTPPADFVVGSIAVPANAVPGRTANFSYTVVNQGVNAAVGSWVDSIYLSSDDVWDVNDPLVHRSNRSGPVAGGASYTESFTAPLPGVVPGNYRVIIRSDILNRIPESNEGNNIGVSLNRAAVDFQELQLGVAASGELAEGRTAYYKVIVPAGETLSLLLNSSLSNGANEVYVAFERIPTRSNYDYAAIDPFEVDQRALVPLTQAGTYFVAVYANDVISAIDTQFYDITAELLNFDVFDTNYGRGGNGGDLTIEVNGAKFDRTVAARITDGSGVSRTARQMWYVDEVVAYATFDLRGLVPGSYDVVISNGEGAIVEVQDGLQIVGSALNSLIPRIDAPSTVRRASGYAFTVSWGNDTLNDVPAPLLLVGNTVPFGFAPGGSELGTRYMFIASESGDSPFGIIRPGQGGTKTFFSYSDTQPGNYTAFVDRLFKDSSALFDWGSARELLTAPSDWPQEEVDAVWEKMIDSVGSKVEDFQRMLAINASLLGRTESVDTLFSRALQLEFTITSAKIFNSVSGRAFSAKRNITLTGVELHAIHSTSGKTFSTSVLRDGSFAFAHLPPGEYTLRVEGLLLTQSTFTIFGDESLSNLTIEATPRHSMTGVVSVAAANIVFIRSEKVVSAAMSDESGHFTLLDVSPDSLASTDSLLIEAAGYARVLLAGREISTALSGGTIVLTSESIVRGVINTIGAMPDETVSVRMTPISGGDLGGWAIVDPATLGFSVQKLRSGQYILDVIVGQGIAFQTNVTVSPSQILDIGVLQVGISSPASVPADAVTADLPFLRSVTTEELVELFQLDFFHWVVQPWNPFGMFWKSPSWPLLLREAARDATQLAVWISGADSDAATLFRDYFDRGAESHRTLGSKGALAQTMISGVRASQQLSYWRTEVLNALENHPDWTRSFECNESQVKSYDIGELLSEAVRKKTGSTNYGDSFWEGRSLAVGGLGFFGRPGSLKPDIRELTGRVTVSLHANQSDADVKFDLKYYVEDAVDFWPDADTGNFLERRLTLGLLDFLGWMERRGWVWEQSFDVAVPIPYAEAPLGVTHVGHDRCDPCDGELPPDDCEETDRPASVDPNDILGPHSFGPEHWTTASQPLNYTIRFENDPVFATAPAQVVRITQTLDSDLDFRTFRVGDFAIGTHFVDVPDNRAFYQERLDLRGELGIFVDVFAGIDVTTGEAFWEFTSIDPATGEQPVDALAGFLPPNLTSPEGEGFVNYSVRPRSTATTGTVIDAEARIVFDVNEPIDTPPIFNTLDGGIPTSSVAALPSSASGPIFGVAWTGIDVSGGSGLADFTIFVSENDGPFRSWLTNTTLTSAQFVGEAGKRYAFYSVARDNAGNQEVAPTTADALIVTPGPAPVVSGVIVQDGVIQRSYVDRFVVDFSGEVNLAELISNGSITSAVILTNLGVNADATPDQRIALAPSQFRYEFSESLGRSRLTWSLDSFTNSRQSLPDGFYRFSLNASLITDLINQGLDGNSDGIGGDNFSFTFHRLAGDANGDLSANAADMTLVNAALGSRPGLVAWNLNADLDRDGVVTTRDRTIVSRGTGNFIAPPSAGNGVTGDYNNDGNVDAADLTVWRNNYGATHASSLLGDGDANGTVDGGDFLIWQRNFGSNAAQSASIAPVATFGSAAEVASAVQESAATDTADGSRQFRSHGDLFGLAFDTDQSVSRFRRDGTRPSPHAEPHPPLRALQRERYVDAFADIFWSAQLTRSLSDSLEMRVNAKSSDTSADCDEAFAELYAYNSRLDDTSTGVETTARLRR